MNGCRSVSYTHLLLKDYWGLGIGTAMFEEMIDKARQEKLEQLELEVIEGDVYKRQVPRKRET